MKLTAAAFSATLSAALSATCAYARLTVTPAQPEVVICLQGGRMDSEVFRATALASLMFARAGVPTVWLYGRHTCLSRGGDPIRISFSEKTPGQLQPRALAYALPFEGTHIRVFHDRVERLVESSAVACVLAHVLVHEVTHILQGLNRHSESGVMKAHWADNDYREMKRGVLAFTDDDLYLIRKGLSTRQRRETE